MDGAQRPLNPGSLRLRLSLWLSVAILAVAVAAGGFSFFSAFDEALRLQDESLLQMAALVDRQHHAGPLVTDSTPQAEDDEDDLHVTIQYLGAPGLPLPLAPTLADGVHTVKLSDDAYRVVVRTLDSGERIAVAQDTDLRDEIALHSALLAIAPILALVPILVILVARLVKRVFRPIEQVAEEINRRGELDLREIAEGRLPSEVRPFVAAINRLFGRVAQSVEAQQRFVADAAHELRSPLTALSLQAERLADAELPDEARARLRDLRLGIDRGRALLEQLLAMARAQLSTSPPGQAVHVRDVFRAVLEDLLPLAQAKGIDVGVVDENGDGTLVTSEIDLLTIVRNLVDNAIRYSPAGGRVDLSSQDLRDEIVLCVSDTGPGIAPAERDRVFDPFYRVLGSSVTGSGLGLSIVKVITQRLGGQVELGYSDDVACQGLRVSIVLPKRA